METNPAAGPTTHPRGQEAGGDPIGALWFGMLGPPLIWAVRIAASYVLVPYACEWDRVWMMHALTAAGILGCLAAAWVAAAILRRTTGADHGHGSNGGAPPGGRIRFMALVGILSGVFFALVIVAEGAANLLIDPCQTAGAPLA